jgi:hypothetical protein
VKSNKIVLSFFLLSFLGCKDSPNSTSEFSTATFSYVARDTVGTVVTTGTLVLYNNNSKITGNWNFDDGRSGDLEGRIDKDSMALNLNPDAKDRNLFLQGRLFANMYFGEWIMYGWGILGRGSFIATRKL